MLSMRSLVSMAIIEQRTDKGQIGGVVGFAASAPARARPLSTSLTSQPSPCIARPFPPTTSIICLECPFESQRNA